MKFVEPAIDGTEGYEKEASILVNQMEGMSFAQLHSRLLPLLPSPPAAVLDLGAGTGRDAAALSSQGYVVTAVEPVRELRRLAGRDVDDGQIAWIDDRLPDLSLVRTTVAKPFEVVLASAVWMHLGPEDRPRAMANVANLLAQGGLFAVTVRHGPIPLGRHMFPVPDDETLGLAQRAGLHLVHHVVSGDGLGRPEYSWSAFAFRRA
jgi:SAM-dependent methyltransferase